MEATLRTTAPQRATTPPAPGALRVTGALTQDAVLRPGTGGLLWLDLHLQPAQGLPYVALVSLGTDLADHMAAEAMLGALRAGAVLSVAAEAMELRTDHGHAALRLVQPHSVLVLQQHEHGATVAAGLAPQLNLED